MKSTLSGLQFCRRQYGSISIRLAVIALQMYKIARNSKKIRTYSSSRSSKVIDLGVNRKPIYDFLLVINSNFGRICYRFRDIDAFSMKTTCFLPPFPCLTPTSGGTPWDINIIYKPLKSTFSGLQSQTIWVYLHSFSRCCLPKSRNRMKFRQNLTLQQFKVIQGHRSWCQWKAHMWLPISH